MYKRKLRGAVLLAASREGDDFSSTDLAGGLHAVCQALEDQVDMDSLDKDGVQRLAVAAKVLSSIVMQRMEWTTTQAAYDAGGIIVKMPTRTHVKRKKFGTIVQVNVDVTARCRDFFERHGGPGPSETREGEGESEGGRRGWSEVDAADGYKLRCDWFRIDDEEQMTFKEIPP